MTSLKNFYVLCRIKHWSKGLFVLLGVFYTDLTGFWPKALLAALSFCLVASAVYIYNDLCDLEEDRRHPLKRYRLLASEIISINMAYFTSLALLIAGFSLAFIISINLAVILSAYVIVNILYNHGLRNIPVLDVLCITTGFMLRVLAGTIGIGLPITWWLTITATLLSLLIALGKRRLEIHLAVLKDTRVVLHKYSPQILDILIIIIAISSFISYVLYISCAHANAFFFLLTIPFAGFGLARFTSLVRQEITNDDPVTLFFRDRFSWINFLVFLILTIMAITR